MTRQPTSSAASAGFTLLEVLLAVVVFSIVLAAINFVFYGALRLRNKTTQAMEQSFTLRQTLAIIQRDLANIVPPGGILFGNLQTDAISGSLKDQANSEFYFYTSAGILSDDAPWSEVQKISYYLADPTNQVQGRDLFRSVTRNLLPVQQEQYEDQFLMGGVSQLYFQFYDGTQWLETWDSSTASSPLPLAIRVEIELARDDKENAKADPDIISLVVPMLVEPGSTNQTPQTSGGEQ